MLAEVDSGKFKCKWPPRQTGIQLHKPPAEVVWDGFFFYYLNVYSFWCVINKDIKEKYIFKVRDDDFGECMLDCAANPVGSHDIPKHSCYVMFYVVMTRMHLNRDDFGFPLVIQLHKMHLNIRCKQGVMCHRGRGWLVQENCMCERAVTRGRNSWWKHSQIKKI